MTSTVAWFKYNRKCLVKTKKATATSCRKHLIQNCCWTFTCDLRGVASFDCWLYTRAIQIVAKAFEKSDQGEGWTDKTQVCFLLHFPPCKPTLKQQTQVVWRHVCRWLITHVCTSNHLWMHISYAWKWHDIPIHVRYMYARLHNSQNCGHSIYFGKYTYFTQKM